MPVQVANLSGIAEISSSASHFLARSAAGILWAWGSNSSASGEWMQDFAVSRQEGHGLRRYSIHRGSMRTRPTSRASSGLVRTPRARSVSPRGPRWCPSPSWGPATWMR
ncbi:hypothetical protein HUW62_30815 [Myxococcus sp. AM011]|nr:hypothetical protein [Myxococcus sp. AM011]